MIESMIVAHTPISIHVPVRGDDDAGGTYHDTQFYFNPRPPCGGTTASTIT